MSQYYPSSPMRFTTFSMNPSGGSPKATNFPSPTTSSPSSVRSDSTAPVVKRKQVKNACVNCQKACKKCDDQRPCSRCVKYGIENGCVNSQRKERKKKSQGRSEKGEEGPLSNTGLRLRINIKDQGNHNHNHNNNNHSYNHLVHQSPTNLRSSTRNGIRAFPKELLESLRGKNEEDSSGEQSDDSEIEEKAINDTSNPASNEFIICPQVTEEFKTLAKLCSDLHTVINNHSAFHAGAPINSFYQPIYPAYNSQFNNRPVSPVYRVPLQQLQQLQLQQQQQRYQHQFYYPTVPVATSSANATASVLPINPFLPQANFIRPSSRDFFNRTPPEDPENQPKPQ